MSAKLTGYGAKFTEEKERMSAVAEASMRMKSIAGPSPVGDYSVKRAIIRALSAIQRFMPSDRMMTFSRAEDIWRGEARRIDAEEMDAIRLAARERIAREEKLVQEAKDELAEFNARIARLEALLLADQDFYSSQVDAIREVARVDHSPVDGR